jgi:hypothetical protein
VPDAVSHDEQSLISSLEDIVSEVLLHFPAHERGDDGEYSWVLHFIFCQMAGLGTETLPHDTRRRRARTGRSGCAWNNMSGGRRMCTCWSASAQRGRVCAADGNAAHPLHRLSHTNLLEQALIGGDGLDLGHHVLERLLSAVNFLVRLQDLRPAGMHGRLRFDHNVERAAGWWWCA